MCPIVAAKSSRPKTPAAGSPNLRLAVGIASQSALGQGLVLPVKAALADGAQPAEPARLCPEPNSTGTTDVLDLRDLQEITEPQPVPAPPVRPRPPAPVPRLTQRIEAAWFAWGDKSAAPGVESPGAVFQTGTIRIAQIERDAGGLSQDEYRKYSLDVGLPPVPSQAQAEAPAAALAPPASESASAEAPAAAPPVEPEGTFELPLSRPSLGALLRRCVTLGKERSRALGSNAALVAARGSDGGVLHGLAATRSRCFVVGIALGAIAAASLCAGFGGRASQSASASPALALSAAPLCPAPASAPAPAAVQRPEAAAGIAGAPFEALVVERGAESSVSEKKLGKGSAKARRGAHAARTRHASAARSRRL
jgi:hypothetical protein